MMKPLSVSEIAMYVDRIVRHDPITRRVMVEGEITNLSRRHQNYFDLKDATARIACVDFHQVITADMKEGDQIVLTATMAYYAPQGKLQLRAIAADRVGRGDDLLALEQLKKKLAAEGLFDRSRKRALPSFPERIGLITSREGAVLHDFANSVARRYPLVSILVSPSGVQGKTAADELIRAFFALLQEHQKEPLDCIVICRGGGSSEDLSVFNDEQLVRTLADSPVPILSAVGHQVDYTLTDLVADQRASTPTEAAELATPDRDVLHQDITMLEERLSEQIHLAVLKKRQRLHQWERVLSAQRPLVRITTLRRSLDLLGQTLLRAELRQISTRRRWIDEMIRSMGRLRDRNLAATSWSVSDLNNQPLLGGALEPGKEYRLLSGRYRYQILVHAKEERDDV